MKYCVIRKESAQKIYTKEDTDIEFIQFKTKENAENYLKYGKIDGVIKNISVFTDGACTNNGKPGAKAGIGVYFGVEDPRNVSRKIDGRQTNNRAELLAIMEVFKILNEEINCGVTVTIYTDSKYSINVLTSWAENWEKNDWKKRNKSQILNLEIIKEGYYFLKKFRNIELKYVEAHTCKGDELSIGNACADNLARQSITE